MLDCENNMTDFETHPRGTIEEIRLSRNLAREIEKCMQMPDNPLPVAVINAYLKLFKCYSHQIASEII